MHKVKRKLVCEGRYSLIEHAICLGGESPSRLALDAMSAGEWGEDPDLEEVPDEAQISQHDKFIVGIEYFAENGYPNNAYCTINNLNDGIWEFRKAKMQGKAKRRGGAVCACGELLTDC